MPQRSRTTMHGVGARELPWLDPLGVSVDLVSRTIEIVYNVKWITGEGDEAILASGARATITIGDSRWDELDSAIRGAVKDLSSSLGLATAGQQPAVEDTELDTSFGVGPTSDDQEL